MGIKFGVFLSREQPELGPMQSKRETLWRTCSKSQFSLGCYPREAEPVSGMGMWKGGMDGWIDGWMKEWPGGWTNGHKLKLILTEAFPQEPYECRSPFGSFFLWVLGVPDPLIATPVAPHPHLAPSQVKVSSSTPNKGIFLCGVNWVEKSF